MKLVLSREHLSAVQRGGDFGPIQLPSPNQAFRPGTFVRAKVVSFNGGENGGSYTLEYVDGPYFCDENPDGATKLLSILPRGVLPHDISFEG